MSKNGVLFPMTEEDLFKVLNDHIFPQIQAKMEDNKAQQLG